MTKSDLILGAPFTGLLTFMLLTWSAGLGDDSPWKPYVTDATVSVVATMASVAFTKVVSVVRFFGLLFCWWVAWKLKVYSCKAVLNCPYQSDKAKGIAQKQLDETTSEYMLRVGQE